MMNSEGLTIPKDNRRTLSASLPLENNLNEVQTEKNEGLSSRLRQTMAAVTKRVQSSRYRKNSAPNLTNLSSTSQELILRAVKTVRNEDSKQIMAVLTESRDMFRNSYEDFKQEQEEYRKQLEHITKQKEAAIGRRKENAIPLSVFLRQKRDVEGLADLRPNSGMNTTYQAYFEALLAPNQNQQQHPSDKAAVIRYIRRRERRKRAEENRQNRELTDDILEKQKAEILKKVDGIDVKLEHERQRQNDLLRTKIHEQKLKNKNMIEATEIIDQAHEANLIRQRIEQKQRDKFEAHLTEVRNRTPTNPIHVQSHDNETDHLSDEQRSATQNSIQLLNDNDDYKSQRSTTPIYGDGDLKDKITNIYI